MFCCGCWAAGEGEAVLERFWGVREAAGFLERLLLLLLLLLLCQGLWMLAGIFLLGSGWWCDYFCCWLAMFVGLGWVRRFKW